MARLPRSSRLSRYPGALHRRAWACFFTLCAALLGILACGSGSAGAVVGVETGLRPGVDFDSLAVTLRVEGETVVERTLSGGQLAFPLEIEFPELDDGEAIEATLLASFGRVLVVERRVASRAVGGRKLLLRAPIEAACSGALAPRCGQGLTCARGECVDPYVDPASAEDYAPSWWTGADDACSDGGEPLVTLGKGQTDYFPLSDGEVLQVEAGPQGGYHVWLSARLKNLRQTGTVNELTGRIEELDYDTPPFAVVFRLLRDEGGFCKIYGLRFRIDGEGVPIESLLGKELSLKLTATDAEGASATAQARVRLSDDFL